MNAMMMTMTMMMMMMMMMEVVLIHGLRNINNLMTRTKLEMI